MKSRASCRHTATMTTLTWILANLHSLPRLWAPRPQLPLRTIQLLRHLIHLNRWQTIIFSRFHQSMLPNYLKKLILIRKNLIIVWYLSRETWTPLIIHNSPRILSPTNHVSHPNNRHENRYDHSKLPHQHQQAQKKLQSSSHNVVTRDRSDYVLNKGSPQKRMAPVRNQSNIHVSLNNISQSGSNNISQSGSNKNITIWREELNAKNNPQQQIQKKVNPNDFYAFVGDMLFQSVVYLRRSSHKRLKIPRSSFRSGKRILSNRRRWRSSHPRHRWIRN